MAALFDKFKKEFKLLRAKRSYYDAMFYVSIDDFVSARKALIPYSINRSNSALAGACCFAYSELNNTAANGVRLKRWSA